MSIRLRSPIFTLLCATLATSAVASAQRGPIGDPIKGYVKVDPPVVALTNVRVIDGSGAPA